MEKKRKYSEAQNKATQRYIRVAYDDIKIRVPKGKRDEYKAYAESKGLSLNKLVVRLLDEDMGKRRNEKKTDKDN